jgi:hypothetical protein
MIGIHYPPSWTSRSRPGEDDRPTPPQRCRRPRHRLQRLHIRHGEPSASEFLSDALSSLQICLLLHNNSCTLQAAPPALQDRRSGTQSASSTPGGLGLGGSCSKTADPSLRHLYIALCVFLFVIFAIISLRKKCKNKSFIL